MSLDLQTEIGEARVPFKLCQYRSLPALIVDARGQAISVNAAFQEFWNADAEKLLGPGGYDVFHDPFFRPAERLKRLQKALLGSPVQFESADYHFPTQYCAAESEGSRTDLTSIFIIPLPAENGEHNLSLFFFDETIHEGVCEHETRCERLAAATASMADLKHEINGPLLLIIGNAQLLLAKGDKLTPDVTRKLHKILSGAERIRQTVQEHQQLTSLLAAQEDAEPVTP